MKRTFGWDPEALENQDKEYEAEQEARAYALSTDPGEHIRPRDLQAVTKGAIGFNAACRILETLEKDGELVRYGGAAAGLHLGTLIWVRPQPSATPSRGYALPLSSREHGALLRLLDKYLGDWQRPEDSAADLRTLRAIRNKMKRPATGQAQQP